MKNPFRILIIVLAVSLLLAACVAQGETPPITLPPITALTIGTIIAALLSLALDYFPGLGAKWDTLSVAAKRQWSAVLAVVIVAAVFTLNCYHIVSTNLVCSPAGAWDAVSNVIYVFVIGQGVHAGTKPTAEFKEEVLNINPRKKGK